MTATVQFTLASTVRSFSCRTAQPQIDRLGTSNVAPLLVGGQINPALSQNHIQVIKNTHGKTSQLSQADLDALVLYLKSLQ